MLIIQVALGIVLAVVILMFLPQIFSLGIWVAILAVGIAVLIGVFFLAIEHLAVTATLVIVVGAFVIAEDIFRPKKRLEADHEQEKKRRKLLGYKD